jgi:plastocyanin
MINIMKKSVGLKSRILAGIAILLSIFTISNNCSKSSDSGGTPGTNEVFIQNRAFDPVTITVPANTTVTWTNKDQAAHTVTSTSAEVFDSGSMGTNDTFPHLFETPGTFTYKCSFHANMTGTVIVN